ncbi:uncharacterized protein LOC131858460 [Cryptomeria japonica]|uniref:uncharacterized protein LOC131858460 n=1 Tax=Cryptomeria japonica TaxID=3369 RepID=UPI0027DA9145|nr:uncharacterized protein LOC131858460 [Cryptomeria japonica]
MVTGLKVEDIIEGALNFTPWKVCILLSLEELELLQFVEDKDLTEPSDPNELKQFKMNALKAKKFLIDFMKDHLVLVISKLKRARKMFKHLEGMYEINNISPALTLRQQLLQVKMSKGDLVMSFFMKTSELKDQLTTIGSEVVDKDIVMIALNGLPDSWNPFIQSITGRAEFPSFDRLRSDCIQEESCLAARGMHKGTHGGDQQCSGASRHITRYQKHLSDLMEKESNLHVVIGDDVRYSDLQTFLWAEASKIAVYIQNRCPHRRLKNITPKEAFTEVKPDINHLRIFGKPVNVHAPKEKRTKLEPSGKKGILVGYSESSKAFHIYIPDQRYIERESSMFPEPIEHGDPFEPLDPTNGPRDIAVSKKRPLWARSTLQEAEKFATPSGTFKKSKRPQKFSNYVAMMCNIIETEPSNTKNAISQQAWKQAMDEKYKSIIQNDVWDIVPRTKVSALRQFMNKPKHVHLVAAKHILRYLCGTETILCSLSTAEAEYIASTVTSREAVWLQKLLVGGALQLKYVSIDEQVADVLTKPLARVKFEYFRDRLGIVENPTITERESQSR